MFFRRCLIVTFNKQGLLLRPKTADKNKIKNVYESGKNFTTQKIFQSYLNKILSGMPNIFDKRYKQPFKKGALNLLCYCSSETETTVHYSPHCPTYQNESHTILSKLE